VTKKNREESGDKSKKRKESDDIQRSMKVKGEYIVEQEGECVY
jgi:hypothetical protein